MYLIFNCYVLSNIEASFIYLSIFLLEMPNILVLCAIVPVFAMVPVLLYKE